MMKKHYKSMLIAVFLLMFFVSFARVKAVSPFESQESTTLRVIYPKNDVFPQNEPIDFHIHLFDSSGIAQTNETIDFCTIHIYNGTNNHILKTNMSFDGVEWEVKLNSTFTESIGVYPYVVWCSGIGEAESGFISGEYYITRSGYNYEDQSGSIASMLFVLGLAGLLFLFGSMINQDQEWSQAVKLLINMIGLFILLLGSGMIHRSLYFFDYPIEVVNLSGMIYFVLLFTILPILLIFLVMFIKEILFFWDELRKGDKF